jgi:ATP-dependent DNA helicase HFM1/MER3
VLNARLDKELFPILVKHSEGQPVLIFCPTRKSGSESYSILTLGCQVTAEEIWKQYGAAQEKGQRLPWIVRGWV